MAKRVGNDLDSEHRVGSLSQLIPVNTWLSNILLFSDCIKNRATSSTMSMLSRTAYIHVSQP